MDHIKILTQKNFTDELRIKYSEISSSSEDINQFVPGLVLQDPQDQKKIEKIFKEAIVCAVYSDDGKIAGLIHAIREKSIFCFSGLNVAAFLAKKYRHKGLMNQAMAEFLSYCKKRTHFSSLFLDIETKNEQSLKSAALLGAKELFRYDSFSARYIKFELKI